MTWYVDNNRTRWRLCHIVGRFAGRVTIRLYDHVTGQFTGQELTGQARRISGGELVEAK